MSTYNGEEFIEEQISSITRQTGVDVSIYIRDDGSTDKTFEVIKKINNPCIKFIYQGENLGYGKSFLELVNKVPLTYDYYSFSDQDDYWLSKKLISAVEKLDILGGERKLYFSNLQIVDEKLNNIKIKNFNNMKISLGSAFVRNRTAGCTYIFNRALFNIVRKYSFKSYTKRVEHDAIVYKLCLVTNGSVYYDKQAYILYRQHTSNVTGSNQGIKKRVRREFLNQFFDNQQRNNMKETASEILKFVSDTEIEKEDIDLLTQISNYDTSFKNKLSLILNKKMDSGVKLFNLKNKFEIFMNVY